MSNDVVAWASAGYLLCFASGWAAGMIHRAIIKLTEGLI